MGSPLRYSIFSYSVLFADATAATMASSYYFMYPHHVSARLARTL